MLVTTIDALDTFKQDNYNTVGGDGGCRVGKVRAGTTSPIPYHKGFKITVRDPPTPSLSELMRLKSHYILLPRIEDKF